MANIDCLATVIKNPGSADLNLSFIPPHGIKLAAGASYVFYGDLVTAILASDGGQRKLKAFKKAVESGKIQVTATPAAIFADDGGNPTTIAVQLGTVVPVTPCSV